MARDQIDREEEAKSEKGAGNQHHAGPAKPVAEIPPERPRLRGDWSFRHRGNYLQLGSKVTLKQPGLQTSSLFRQLRNGRGSSPDFNTSREFKQLFFE